METWLKGMDAYLFGWFAIAARDCFLHIYGEIGVDYLSIRFKSFSDILV